MNYDNDLSKEHDTQDTNSDKNSFDEIKKKATQLIDKIKVHLKNIDVDKIKEKFNAVYKESARAFKMLPLDKLFTKNETVNAENSDLEIKQERSSFWKWAIKHFIIFWVITFASAILVSSKMITFGLVIFSIYVGSMLLDCGSKFIANIKSPTFTNSLKITISTQIIYALFLYLSSIFIETRNGSVFFLEVFNSLTNNIGIFFTTTVMFFMPYMIVSLFLGKIFWKCDVRESSKGHAISIAVFTAMSLASLFM